MASFTKGVLKQTRLNTCGDNRNRFDGDWACTGPSLGPPSPSRRLAGVAALEVDTAVKRAVECRQ